MRISYPALVSLSVPALGVACLLFTSALHAEHTPHLRPVAAATPFPLTVDGSFQTTAAIAGQPAVAADGSVYFGAHDGFLYALDARANLRWKRDLEAPIHGGVLIGEAGEVYVGTDGASFWSFDRQGRLRFRQSVEAAIETTPAWSNAGQVLVCVGRELLSFKTDGTLAFRFRTWGKLFSSPITDREGRAYVGSQDGNFYALGLDGSERFRVYVGDAIDADAVLDAEGNAFFADETGRVYAIDVTGEQRWVRNLGSQVRAPLALGPAGEVLVITRGPQLRLVALSAVDGTIVIDRTLALSDAAEAGRGSGITVDATGRLWLGSPVDRVWVFEGVHAAPQLVPVRAELTSQPFVGNSGQVVLADRAGQVWFGHLGVNATLLP